jgi:carboxyl-terminal processing protease
MGHTRSCTTVFLVVVVGVLMATLGFATGFITHRLLVADSRPVAVVGEGVAPAEPLAPVAEPTALPPTARPDTEDAAEPLGGNATDTPAPGPVTDEPDAGLEPQTTTAIPEAFGLFWEAWALIEDNFYGELPGDEELTYGALRGALATLDDPNTGFIEPDIAAISREDASGTFEGIGALVRMEEGRLVIVRPMTGQPAERAGIQRGDIVLQVDDTPIENMSVWEAISLIRGPAGTSLRLTLLRAGEAPFEVQITRARIEIEVTESEMLEGGIAHVRLNDFSAEAHRKLAEEIEELLTQDLKGLILDLRGNPGGFLGESVQVAGLFLPEGEVVLIERHSDGTEKRYRVPEGPIVPDLPLVLLVDAGSASASEIVAGALQDYGRAVLIGETTFGKGSIQLAYELSNGAELRVTIARFYTPRERVIHEQGVEPDIAVELTEEDLANGLDPQLERAVEYLRTGQ